MARKTMSQREAEPKEGVAVATEEPVVSDEPTAAAGLPPVTYIVDGVAVDPNGTPVKE